MLNLITNVLNLFVAFAAGATGSSSGPTPVTFQRSREEFRVLLGSQVIYKEEPMLAESPKVAQEGMVGRERYLLIESYNGDGCPAMYTLLTIDDHDRHQQFPIGNCESAKLAEDHGALEIVFEGFQHPDLPRPRFYQHWRYEDGELRRLDR